MAFDPGAMKLGRKAPDLNTLAKRLRFAKYVLDEEVKVPDSFDWTDKVPAWDMLLNDRLGDCVIAGVFHMIRLWTAQNGYRDSLGETEVVEAYQKFCGYNPNDPSTDQGCVIQHVLEGWKKDTVGYGHSNINSAVIEQGNVPHLKMAVYLFGGAIIGLNLPLSAQAQVEEIWSVTSGGESAPGSWGGHCVPVVAYKPGLLACVTWGKIQVMTEAFYKTYCDEAHAVLSKDWIGPDGKCPIGFDLKTLMIDLHGV